MLAKMKFSQIFTIALLFSVPVLSPSQDSAPASAPAVAPTPTVPKMKVSDRIMSLDETTPESFPGIETFPYRDLSPKPLLMHVAKPEGWQVTDKRPALIWFFGGGFTHGTPKNSVGWAKLAAQNGMVGFAPDYRTLLHFDTTPQEALADARYSLRYVQEHADELGIDPTKVIVCGSSAGGALALWSALETNPPGSLANEKPLYKPAGLVLLSPVSDTSFDTGYGASRIGYYANEISPFHYLDEKMPPTLLYHGDADESVSYSNSVALHAKLLETGNICELITCEGGSHKFPYELEGWKDRIRAETIAFSEQHAPSE